MKQSTIDLLVELSTGLLARAADEAEKRTKQADRSFGKYSGTDAEVKRRQAYRFNKAVADRTLKSANTRSRGWYQAIKQRCSNS